MKNELLLPNSAVFFSSHSRSSVNLFSSYVKKRELATFLMSPRTLLEERGSSSSSDRSRNGCMDGHGESRRMLTARACVRALLFFYTRTQKQGNTFIESFVFYFKCPTRPEVVLAVPAFKLKVALVYSCLADFSRLQFACTFFDLWAQQTDKTGNNWAREMF